jgi:hypothetical protein
MNLYEGDTLEMDIESVWNDKFDVVVVNALQYRVKTTGASALYNVFIERYIDKCNYMSFIIPSRWFLCGKGLDKFQKKC